MKWLLLCLSLLLTSCDTDSLAFWEDDEEEATARPVDRFDMRLVPIVDINASYMSVAAQKPGEPVFYYVVRYDTASKIYEYDSCSNHTAPNRSIGPGDYVDIVADLNAVEKDTGAITGLQVFFHHPACLTERGFVQTDRTTPR